MPSNWFEGFDAEFANIYCGPGMPLNKCCQRYFQVTDWMMVKSFFGKKAGVSFSWTFEQMRSPASSRETYEKKNDGLYRFLKSISGNLLRAIRSLIWLIGKYNYDELEKFINDFQPDVVFHPRLLTHKLLRLDNIIHNITSAPIVAMTGDDEVSLREVSFSPIYWISRISLRRKFIKSLPIYRYYMMHSKLQAKEYSEEFGLETSIIYKCVRPARAFRDKPIGKPIVLTYAGKLYCGRWETLLNIGRTVDKINHEYGGELLQLNIYTQDRLSATRKNKFQKCNVSLWPAVPPEELDRIYDATDIALHVESFRKRYALLTRYSCSTKVVDMLKYSCSIMAVCWSRQNTFEYLKENDAAICVGEEDDLYSVLDDIVSNPSIIRDFAKRAHSLGEKNHNVEMVQQEFSRVFTMVKK